ncbi:MAG: 50S ribosomal protein L10 [Myxococcales bacterium]
MDRTTKEQVVEDLKGEFAGVQAILVAEYRKLTVEKVVQLRKSLRENGVKYRVVKNTLAKRAIEGTDKQFLGKYLHGPMALAWSSTDPVAAAKVLTDFAKTNEALTIKAGYLTGQELNLDGIKALAALPSKDELRASFLSVLQAPAAKFVTVLSQAQRDILSVLLQHTEKLGESTAA